MSDNEDLGDDFINSDPRYRTVQLLQEYRRVKKQQHEAQLQNFKNEMEQNLMEDDPDDIDVRIKMKENTSNVSDSVEFMIQTYPETIPSYTSDTDPSLNITPSHSDKTKTDSTSSTSSPSKTLTPSLDPERIEYFNELIEIVAKLYKIPSEEQLTLSYSQLMDLINILKHYKLSTDNLAEMEQRCDDMIKVKSQVDKLFELDSLKTQLQFINQQMKNKED